jgi:hypothetical protein
MLRNLVCRREFTRDHGNMQLYVIEAQPKQSCRFGPLQLRRPISNMKIATVESGQVGKDSIMIDSGFILVPSADELLEDASKEMTQVYLTEIDKFVESLSSSLWSLNKFIHENPELAFKEHKAHEALTEFMRSQNGWKVTASAYEMETAWIAAYDSKRAGPVVSFNAEMGTSNLKRVRNTTV